MKKNNGFAKACLFGVILLVSIVSCEVGLGSAVDTQPPSVSISYPPSLSVIRDSFVFAGNWSDDRSIESIFVEVYQIKDDQKTVVFKEEADSVEQLETENPDKQVEGTWSITLNKYDVNNTNWYNGWQFCDGDYEIQVYAKDNAKQVSSVASRTISIDNTAPVLLLTNPISAGSDSSPASFGQIIQLTGYFYEFTGKISNLTVSFYDEAGNALFDSNFTNITSMSDLSPLIVARYFSTDEERAENSQIFNNYAKLLGENQIELFDQGQNVENKKIYFTVTASDNAREYKTIGDSGTGEGNLTKHFYRGTTSMQNLVSGDGGIENFSLTDFAQYMNGTSNKYVGYSQKINEIANAARSVSVTNVSAASVADYISNNDSKTGDPVYLTFVLNPKNNPLYSFGGYEVKQNGDSDNYSTNGYKFVYTGTSLPLSITVGTDNKNISTHTVSVYKIDKSKINTVNPSIVVNDEFFKVKENLTTNGYFELMYTWDEDVIERFNEWGIDITGKGEVTDSDANTASLSKQFAINELVSGNEYDFYVVGKDISGSSIIATNTRGYGFCGKVSQTAPQINVTSTEFVQNAIVNESIFKGTGADGDEGAQNKVLYLGGTIKTDQKLIESDNPENSKFGFGYKLTISNSSSSSTPVVLEKAITRGDAAPQATDRTSNYCYITNDTSPYIYNWRFTTTEFAEDPAVEAFISNPDSYELSLELIAYNSDISKSSISRTFTLDTEPPHPELSEITVAVEKTENVYWINPKNPLVINGLVTDNLSTAKACKTWWKLIALNVQGEEVSGSEQDNQNDSDTTGVNKWNFTIPANTIASTYYGAHLYIYSKDVAGNEYNNEAEPYTLIFDTTAPVGIHKIDAKGKDVVFRIGDNDNDDIDESSTSPAWDSALDTNVGGKYSSETYGNSETIDIRGYFDDGDGSQVDLVYYKVFHSQPSESEVSNFLENYKTAKDGSFSLISPVGKRVFCTHNTDTTTIDWDADAWAGTEFGSGKYYLDDVKYNFYTTISGLTKGVNYLMLVAVDKVGNAAKESVPVAVNGVTNTYPDYIINVDTTAPSVPKEKIYAPTTYYNPNDTDTDNLFKVYGIAKDDDSGIREVGVVIDDTELIGEYNKTSKKTILYRVNENTQPETKTEVGNLTLTKKGTVSVSGASFNGDTLSDKNALWSIELNKDAFTGIESGDSASISVKVTDNAGTGNTITRPVANVMIDTEGPSVDIKSPENGATVNGKITVSVSANDGTGAGISSSDPVIERKNGTSWENLDVDQSFNNGTGSFELNTKQFNDNEPVTLKISFKDKVNNTGFSEEYTLNIDQDGDRPLITLSQLAKNTETTLRVKNVYGSVSDDDGTVQKMWYWSKQKKGAAPTEAPTLTDNKGWTAISVNGGSWSVDSTEDDGETTWYFAVADAQDGIFTTIGDNTLKQPKLKYSDIQNPVDGIAEGVSFKYDTNPPTPTYLGLYRADAETNTTATTICANDNDDDDTNDVSWKTENGISFGKEYDVLYAKVIVEEGTGMKALEGNAGSKPTNSPITISYKDGETLTVEKIQHKDIPATETESAKYIYYLGPIKMDTTESCEFKVTVEDAVGNKGYISRNIIVDNKAPEKIDRVNPKASSEANGTFVYRGNVSDNDGGSGVETIEWYIPKDTETSETANGIEWKTATLSAGWEIDFSGDRSLSTIIGYEVSGVNSSVSTDYDGYDIGDNTGVYQIPVWFRITDAVGNVGYNKENSIKFNPNTDRPSAQITSPTHDHLVQINGETVNYVIMGGGSARISGSADDNEGIEAVYLQFDLDGDGYWDNGVKDLTADLATLPTSNDQMMSFCPWTYDKVEEILGDASKYGYGIRVGITKNWSYTIDLSGEGFPTITETASGTEPNITYTYDGNTIKVRAISVDNDTENGKLTSAPSDVLNISVSNDIPLFNNLKLKQISGNTVNVEMDYVPGQYLTGSNWFITGDVSAYGGISSASYEGTVKVTNASSFFTSKAGSTDQYDMKIPIEPDDNGKWNVSITVSDSNSPAKQNIQQIQINIDNTAPTFNDTYSQSEESVNGTVKHYLGGYGSKGKALTPSLPFADTDGLSSIWGKVTDGGSGFSKAVFYFKRFEANGTSDPRVYNPFGTKNENRTDLNSTKAVGKVYIDSSSTGDNLPSLYVKTVDGKMTVSRPSEFAIKITLNDNSLTGVAGNTNIRKGGLIKIGGIYRTITSVENDGTINFDTSCDTSYTEAEIIYAMVVDMSGESTNNDVDSDGLIENISTVSSTTTWNAALPTSTIPDGPIQLHVVVFDEAGNIAHGYTKTAISNNPLRITKVMLGTDLNRNGTYETASEFESYWAVTNTRGEHDLTKGKEIWDLDTKGTGASYFIAKKELAVIPEFVGGTGNIYYAFTKSTANRTEPQKQTSPSDSNMLKTLTTIVGEVSAEGTGNSIGQLVIDNNTINDSGEDAMRVFSFSFWDSTESSTVGTNSSWTVLNAMIHQDLTDGTKPIAKINPFRWVDKTDNSIEWDTEGNALGHIELENDWTAVDSESNKLTGWDGKTDGTTYLDSDPKVSGKIKIEGTAFDETRLSSITVTFGNKTATANYSTGWSDGAADEDFVLTVADSGPTQNGHSVIWTLVVDTSKVVINNGTTKVAEKNIVATVSAKDASNNQNTASTTQTNKTTQTSYYRMDIVPYITGIDTALSKLKKNNPSVYARTALGHYAVASNEVLKIQGFNINGGVLKFKKTETTTVNSSYSEESAGYIIPSTAITGNVSITVNSIESLNNINNNDAYGTAYNIAPGVDAVGAVYKDKKFYNRQPNGDNNNLLTDDLVLDIWQITSKAAKPNSGPLSQPVMAINPKNKQVGFAFANGPLRFSMGSVEKSYDFWEYGLDFWTSIGFTYDANGNSFGTTAGGDIGGGGKSDCFGLFTSRWATKGFTSGTGGHNNGTGQLRLELIGQAESSNGTSFNGDNIDKQRIKSPSITTTVASSDATETNVYLAYYDAINNEIRFKWGIISDANNTTGRSQNNLLYDYYGPSNSDGSDKPSMDTTTKTLSLTQSKLAGSLPYTLEYVSLIAGQTTGKYTFVPGASGTKYTANTAVMTNEEHPQAVNAGQYVSIAAKQGGGDTYERTIQKSVLDADGKATASEVTVSTADDLVVAVWYDAANNQMLYSYNTKPQNIKAPTYKGNNRYIDNGDGTSSGIDSFSQSATGWSTPVAVFGEGNGIGEYCKVVLDSFGKVHIACYDNANADVWYAYIDDFEHPENAKTCVVDSYGIVGTELSLDVAYVNSNPVPYISYYGSSCVRPKVAYWASTDSIVTASSIEGAEEEAFTKNWEVSIIPSGSKISIDHVNVGVWKDNSGNLTYSTLDGNVPNGIQAGKEGSNLGKANAGTTEGMVYGNGTKNPILGYAITQGAGGYIETAQMK